MEYAVKVGNIWIENTADLLREWYYSKKGNTKGIAGFLKEESLDKLFTARSFVDAMNGKAKILPIFAAPMAKACPFELSLKEASDIIRISKAKFRLGYDIQMDRKEVIIFHSKFMTSSELKKLKKKVVEDAYYDEEYKDVVKNLGKDTKRQHFYYRKNYLVKNGIDIEGWSDEKILSYKVKPGKTKEQRVWDCKRSKMLKRGFDEASYMSYEEIASFKFPKKEIIREETSFDERRKSKAVYNKRFRIKERGIDVAKMSNEEITGYNLIKLKPGRVPTVISKDDEYIILKRKRMRKAGINEADMSNEEVRAYIKPKTNLSKEQRAANKKRKSLERQGFKVDNLSDAEIMQDRRFTGRRSNQEVWIDKKRKDMIANNVENAVSMSDEEIKQYSSKYKMDGSWSRNPKLYKKKKYLDTRKINYEHWTEQEILEYDGRNRDALKMMEERVAKRKEKNIDIYHLKKVAKINKNKEKSRRSSPLEIVDKDKKQKASQKYKAYYQNKKRREIKKEVGNIILALLNNANKKST